MTDDSLSCYRSSSGRCRTGPIGESASAPMPSGFVWQSECVEGRTLDFLQCGSCSGKECCCQHRSHCRRARRTWGCTAQLGLAPGCRLSVQTTEALLTSFGAGTGSLLELLQKGCSGNRMQTLAASSPCPRRRRRCNSRTGWNTSGLPRQSKAAKLNPAQPSQHISIPSSHDSTFCCSLRLR